MERWFKILQFNKNNSHHSGINRTSYKAMFGSDAKLGLTSSPLPQEILSTLSTEEDLVAHLENKQTQDPTLQISSVQACDNPSTDANDFVHDVPSETSLDIVQCAVCEMPCFDFINVPFAINLFKNFAQSQRHQTQLVSYVRMRKTFLQKGHKL